jgi:Fur family transcriptional regulator, peroxide stress response regulator
MKRRQTIQREALLDILSRGKTHPTADILYEEVRKSIPSISKGTVYRNLKVLEEMGLINELQIEGKSHRYEYRRGHHSHFHCERCGAVIDVEPSLDADLDNRFTALTGLTVSHHQLEFHGLCRDCQQKEEKFKEVDNEQLN